MQFTLDEIKTALKVDHWDEITTQEDPHDWLTEFADGLVPVYNSEIIKDWQDMPSEYDDSGADLCSPDAGICDRMKADLWYYYQDQTRIAYEQVKGEMEDAND